MAAVRYRWLFRTAAVVYLFFGAAGLWRYALTDYDPAHRPVGLAIGALAVVVGVYLFVPKRFAIALSAIGAAIVAIAAALAVPVVQGPVIVVFGLLAIVLAVYATLAARVLFERAR